MNDTPKLVIFSDLVGSLLDHEHYSFAPAKEALRMVRSAGIPLVLCSSKTRAEITVLQQELGIQDPFIVENGGAVFAPRGYFPFPIPGARPVGAYDLVEFGIPYFRLVRALHRAAEEEQVSVRGFSDLSIEEVAKDCDISLSQALLAKSREYDEPFRVLDGNPAASSRLLRSLHRAGLRCSIGNRYLHLIGLIEREMPVRLLKDLYRHHLGRVRFIGLGDSLNDLPLLREMDVPVVVRNPALGASASLLKKTPTARITAQTGPAGWNEIVIELLQYHATLSESMRGAQGENSGREVGLRP